MIGRLFWFALGAGVAVWGVGKLRRTVRRASPEVLGHQVADSVLALGDSARDFVDRARAAMAEREAELRAELNLPGSSTDRLGLPE
jgi:hypothetical protein